MASIVLMAPIMVMNVIEGKTLMTNRLTDFKKITKLHIHIENVSIRIDVPLEQCTSVKSSEFHTCLKRDKPLHFKDKNLK